MAPICIYKRLFHLSALLWVTFHESRQSPHVNPTNGELSFLTLFSLFFHLPDALLIKSDMG